ncbi:MAG: hypothetical protein ACJAZO_000762 [Myxococcota bacterium]|jgi:hypothetical protein
MNALHGFLQVSVLLIPTVILAVYGVVLALRFQAVFILYTVAAVVRVLTSVVLSLGILYAEVIGFPGLLDINTTRVLAIAVVWMESAGSPAITLAVITGPILWIVRTASLAAHSLPDPQ